MSIVNFKREISASMDQAIERVTQALQKEGFGILTRIDFHTKIKEKLNKEIPQTVILGACNPQLAYDAFVQNTDVASLLPCNAVMRTTDNGKISVEIVKPTALMEVLGDKMLIALAEGADQRLQNALERI